AFRSAATDLVANDNNHASDVFVRDMQTGVTRLVSISKAGGIANDMSAEPTISSDGRFVAFSSFASNIVDNDTNARTDVFVRDMNSNSTTLLSVNTAGTVGNSLSFDPSISGDGRFVSFRSDASDLTTNDHNGMRDVFVRDTVA